MPLKLGSTKRERELRGRNAVAKNLNRSSFNLRPPPFATLAANRWGGKRKRKRATTFSPTRTEQTSQLEHPSRTGTTSKRRGKKNKKKGIEVKDARKRAEAAIERGGK